MRCLMQRLSLFCLLLGLAATSSHASGTSSGWTLETLTDGLHALCLDSTRTKSLLVESADSLWLIEAAISSKGGNARQLQESREGGAEILSLLADRFPRKALAAVLHSHWHPHSISTLTPFLEAGVPLITTRDNFKRVREFLDPELLATDSSLIHFVESDSLVLGEDRSRIVAYRLSKADYPSLPTPDYLLIHLSGHNVLQCGCMYRRGGSTQVGGKDLISSRNVDLQRFLSSKQLPIEQLARLYLEPDSVGQLLPFSGLAETIQNGVTLQELAAPFQALETDSLLAARDRLLADAARDGLPASLFNRLVFAELQRQDLPRARIFAELQILLNPADANAWDTMGEVHYFAGRGDLASHFEKQSTRIDSSYTGGGAEVWQQDLETHRKQWLKASTPDPED